MQHTKLSRFCQHFESTVRPLLQPMGAAITALGRNQNGDGELRGVLGELHHQLGSLIDKVAGQQAYVLIFGPLKSGKSTLMNALAASYVSEVSSLPAYPCLVFVRYGDKRQYGVTTYEGATTSFDDPALLHDMISSAHGELAGAIRAAEEQGETFDPRTHYPAAIRKVDVEVPAPELKHSAAVLVDTPGLYTRMRFGYDRVTREFRNSAATAVFVVKSENLFLEQVFDEFHQLLKLFSRIFLVVNMDTAKRDVGPSGDLEPSLEKRDPKAIIDAFQNLAMTAPLRRALEEGRLRLHPVDLMSSASVALKRGQALPEDFAGFQKELTEYLASADYLKAFLGDSLRRGHALVREVVGASQGEQIESLHRERARLAERIDELRASQTRLLALLDLDPESTHRTFVAHLEEEVKRRSRDDGAKLARSMGASLNTWFLSSHSLKSLLVDEWAPMVREYWSGVQDAAARAFEQSCSRGEFGLDLDRETVQFLERLDIDVSAVRRAAERDLPPTPTDTGLAPVSYDEIPLRRGVLDLVAFRATDQVRERLFGPFDDPDRKIPARTKAARLGEPAQHAMRESMIQFHRELLPHTVDATIARWGQALAAASCERLKAEASAHIPDLDARVAAAERELAALDKGLRPLEELAAQAEAVRTKVHALATQYAGEEAEALLTPDGPVLEPAPRRADQEAEPAHESRRARRRRQGR